MATHASRRTEDEENRLSKHAGIQAVEKIANSRFGFGSSTGGAGIGAEWKLGEFILGVGVCATSSGSGLTTLVYTNEHARENEYFKPAFAEQLRRMEAAPIDEAAPEGEQEFIDWLNAE